MNPAEFWGTFKYTLLKPFIKITEKVRIMCRRSEREKKKSSLKL